MAIFEAKCTLARIEPEVSFARLFVGAVALVAVVRQDRQDLPIEIHGRLRRANASDRTCQKHGQTKQANEGQSVDDQAHRLNSATSEMDACSTSERNKNVGGWKRRGGAFPGGTADTQNSSGPDLAMQAQMGQVHGSRLI
jgi:hypothetical protein